MGHVACVTWGASRGVRHVGCVTWGASRGVRHVGCITWGASRGVHHVGCVTWGASHVVSLCKTISRFGLRGTIARTVTKMILCTCHRLSVQTRDVFCVKTGPLDTPSAKIGSLCLELLWSTSVQIEQKTPEFPEADMTGRAAEPCNVSRPQRREKQSEPRLVKTLSVKIEQVSESSFSTAGQSELCSCAKQAMSSWFLFYAFEGGSKT